jgi:hypothetical protein
MHDASSFFCENRGVKPHIHLNMHFCGFIFHFAADGKGVGKAEQRRIGSRQAGF